MTFTQVLLIILITLLAILLFIIIYARIKIGIFFKKNTGTFSILKGYENYHVDNVNTPRSISSLEPVYINDIKKDYPNLNINELKSNAEKAIINLLMAVESKNTTYLSGYNPKIIAFAESKIKDNKKNVKYENIKIHRTAINKYVNKKTIVFTTTFEYNLKRGNDYIKVQDRMKTEYTYNKDRTNKDLYKLGLNCPNCGATITDEEHHKCDYCGATALNIEVLPWQLNNIKED